MPAGKKIIVTDDLRKEIVKNYTKDNITITKIALKFKMSRNTISEILRGEDVQIRPGPLAELSDEQLEKIKKNFLEDCHTINHIAQLWNLSPGTIERALRRKNVDTSFRPRTQWQDGHMTEKEKTRRRAVLTLHKAGFTEQEIYWATRIGLKVIRYWCNQEDAKNVEN